MTEFTTIAAVAENGIIGDGRHIPWDYPADSDYYRSTVRGHPVIVGRVTYEVMRGVDEHPLVVVLTSRDLDDAPDHVRVARDVEEAVAAVEDAGYDTGYVIGGEGVYAGMMPHVDRIVLTHIPGEYDGDTRFPGWENRDEWAVIDREQLTDDLEVVHYRP